MKLCTFFFPFVVCFQRDVLICTLSFQLKVNSTKSMIGHLLELCWCASKSVVAT
ncbi:hypothetical protein Syun_008913 [Stephania yunnanensis]|uniref:Uncharacterized protein n=1 Tax=Stephania yunnanensis TaxID=152371 RepID=A0AAP0KFF1_9MAGN